MSLDDSCVDGVAASNLKLMFDCYHVQLMEGDLTHRIEALLPWIGHFQFASVPDRGAPDHGEINYDAQILTHLCANPTLAVLMESVPGPLQRRSAASPKYLMRQYSLAPENLFAAAIGMRPSASALMDAMN